MRSEYSEFESMARILIIDDDASLRTMLGEVLKAAGHEVALAADGKAGVALHRAVPVDLVITDLFMPDQEGLETIIELRKNYPGVAIIAMTGKTPAHAMLAVARQLGATGTLEKSFSADELLLAVDAALRRETP
jgi:DNA-binding response OmpR family regulator